MYKGPYFAVMEQQAIFASKMIQGQVSIDIEMCKQELRLEEDIREQVPRPQFPHPEYVKFADDVAKINGNLPTFDLLTKEISKKWKIGQLFLGLQVALELLFVKNLLKKV